MRYGNTRIFIISKYAVLVTIIVLIVTALFFAKRAFDNGESFDANLATEIIGIIITVIIIDRVYQFRIKETEKGRVISQINSDSSDIAKEGIRLASISGWLYDSSLDKVGFFRANWEQSILFHASLKYVILCDCNLRKVDLRKADLSNAILVLVDLSNADLRHANFCNAQLWGVTLDGADIRGTNFSGAKIMDSKKMSAKMTREIGKIFPRHVPTYEIYEEDFSGKLTTWEGVNYDNTTLWTKLGTNQVKKDENTNISQAES